MFTASINLHSSQVKIGLYVPHDPHIIQPIEWKNLVLNAAQVGAVEMRKELEKHGRDMRKKVSRGVRTCSDEQDISWTDARTARHHFLKTLTRQPDKTQTCTNFKQACQQLCFI